MASVAPAGRISMLITDDNAAPQELIELEAIGVEIVTVSRPVPRQPRENH
jgi:hypothetical protein